MPNTTIIPKPPKAVADVYKTCPPAARDTALAVRSMIFETATTLPETCALTETLKWGEPAYLTEKTKSGTTIRIGWSDDTVSLYVHCQTTLVEEWRAQYEDTLTFVGNREIKLPIKKRLPKTALKHCIAMALTYHSRKRAK